MTTLTIITEPSFHKHSSDFGNRQTRIFSKVGLSSKQTNELIIKQKCIFPTFYQYSITNIMLITERKDT